MTRAGLFARVSTDEQGEGVSIEAQVMAMRGRCEAEGWEVGREFVAIGESAFTGELSRRPVLVEALEAAERAEFDVLLVHESSRLARDVGIASLVLRRLEKAGVRLVNVSQSMDYGTPEGRLFYGFEGAVNEYYSRKVGEHIRKSKRAMWEQGFHVGDVPFGYRRVRA